MRFRGVTHDEHRDAVMTTYTEARRTRRTFAITVAVCIALLGGLIIGTAMWPKAHAASAGSEIEITAPLISNAI